MSDIKLPDLGENVEKAVVSFWHVEVGESIDKDGDLVEMLTDKATFNVPAPVSGKITKILVEEGVEVKVGESIAQIEEA
ncbi:biotin/lipoyl-containing protein [Candidatus Omnitrophota bacterium]